MGGGASAASFFQSSLVQAINTFHPYLLLWLFFSVVVDHFVVFFLFVVVVVAAFIVVVVVVVVLPPPLLLLLLLPPAIQTRAQYSGRLKGRQGRGNKGNFESGQNRFCLFVCFNLLVNVPFHTLVYFRDGSAQTSLRAATLRQKLQIKAFHLTQSQYTDTGPTSPRADPTIPGAWQGSHWNAYV